MNIIEKYRVYNFDKIAFLKEYHYDYSNGFIVKLKLKSLPSDNKRRELFRCPFFSITAVKLHKEKDKEYFSRLEKIDRTFIYADNEGYLYFLEINAIFQSEYANEPKEYTLDLPLNIFNVINQDIYFLYNGVVFGWVIDGEIVNLDYPFGKLMANNDIKVHCENNLEVLLSNQVACVRWEWETKSKKQKGNYYSPRGYNAWAGDVVNFYHNGCYHLLYLIDRHHHASRFGCGAHTMGHLITKDFVNWEECEPLVELDEQWKSLGTGTMFFYDGKYYFSYGWHTSRTIPHKYTGTPILQQSFDEKGFYQGVSYEELKEQGLYPSGAAYSVSDDGKYFHASEVQFHVAENPSLYVENGKFVLYAGYGSNGIWEAENLDGLWLKKADLIAPGSITRPTTECTCVFSLNGYKYIIMGGTGYWKTKDNENEFIDEAKNGDDVYDGLVYPMATVTENGRILMGGWLQGYGWGSVIVQRELFQDENGRLYMCWLNELSPNKDEMCKVLWDTDTLCIKERQSYYFELTVNPEETGKIGIRFCGETDCMLWLDTEKKQIQICNIDKDRTYPEQLMPAYIIAQEGDLTKWNEYDIPKKSYNFCLANADVLKEKYILKIQLYYEEKFDSVIIDCEISGKRTLVSNRINQRFTAVKILNANVEVSKLEAYEF